MNFNELIRSGMRLNDAMRAFKAKIDNEEIELPEDLQVVSADMGFKPVHPNWLVINQVVVPVSYDEETNTYSLRD